MIELRPPERWAHLRWHWIQMITWIDPRPVEWCSEGDFWRYLGVATLPDAAVVAFGWRYHGPCDPNTITPDPGNVEQVKVVARILALADRHDPDELSNPIAKEAPPTPWWKRYRNTAILGLTALRDMKGAGG